MTFERKGVSCKSLGNIGTAAGITGRTINEKCPIHQGVDTVDVDNDRGWAEGFQCVKSLVLTHPVSCFRGVVLRHLQTTGVRVWPSAEIQPSIFR